MDFQSPGGGGISSFNIDLIGSSGLDGGIGVFSTSCSNSTGSELVGISDDLEGDFDRGSFASVNVVIPFYIH